MKSKQVATVVQRADWRDDTCIFTCRNPIVGNYDEEERIFTDNYGNVYCTMLSSDAIVMNEKAVYNIQDIDELRKLDINKNKRIDEIIADYYRKVESIAYIIGYTDDYIPFAYPISADAIQEEVNKIKEAKPVNELDSKATAKLEQLMLDAVDGKYTKEQLKEMIETLEDAKDTIENTIDTMENKISAMDSNMSFKDYLNQQLNTQTEEKLKPKPLPKKATTNQEKPQKNLVKRKELIYNIDDMFNEVRKTIIAQDEPLKRLISEIVRKDMNPILKRQGIMLSGATGTGKTEMMRQLGIYLEKNIGKKLYIVDSSQLTKEGYVGKDIEKVFYELLLECKRDIKKAENSILYIDEIDKKASQNNDDPAGKGVLNMFLKLIEGTVFDASPNNKSTDIIPIDTTDMTIIVGGAFTDVYSHFATNNMGFSREIQEGKKRMVPALEDFEKYGMMPREFLGRLLHIPLNPLYENDFKRILLESNDSAIKHQEKSFGELGVKIIFTDEFISKIARQAYLSKAGARGLYDAVYEATSDAYTKVYMDCYNKNYSYKELLITEKTLEDNSNYQLVKRRTNKNKK